MNKPDLPPIGNATIETIYALLEGLDGDLATLNNEYYRQPKIDVYILDNLCEAVELLEFWGYGSRLGLNSGDILKLQSHRGKMGTNILRKVAERGKTLLKELEGEIARAKPEIDLEAEDDETYLDSDYAVAAVGWVQTPRSAHVLIAEISACLHEVLVLVQSSNTPIEEQAISGLERAQLIALLQTALDMLKAPLQEKGLLGRVVDAARSGAEAATKKKTEAAMGYGLGKLAELVLEFLKNLG